MQIRPPFARGASRARAAWRTQAGFTLIEILVAILVLSFGMLGVVGLQAAALQANKEARYQSSAVRMARELGDMMRGNKNVAVATSAASNPYLGTFTTAAPPASGAQDCFKVLCTSITNIASHQIADWFKRVDSELPGVQAVICFDNAPYDNNGLPKWACSGNGTGVNNVAVLKLGWSRQSTNRAADGSAGKALVELAATTRPSFIMPLIAGEAQ